MPPPAPSHAPTICLRDQQGDVCWAQQVRLYLWPGQDSLNHRTPAGRLGQRQEDAAVKSTQQGQVTVLHVGVGVGGCGSGGVQVTVLNTGVWEGGTSDCPMGQYVHARGSPSHETVSALFAALCDVFVCVWWVGGAIS